MSSIPKNRAHLLELIETQFSKLWAVIEPITEEESAIPVDDTHSIKDILATRVWWSAAVIKWILAGQKGKQIDIPAKGYNWQQTPALNRSIADASRDQSVATLRKKLKANKNKVIRVIDTLTDDELQELQIFSWTGKWPVMRWVSVGTSSQYAGATRQIRKALRAAKR